MKKNKKKNKKNTSLFKKLKSAIPNDRVLYSLLGALGAGIAIGSSIGKENRQALIDTVTSTFQGLRSQSAADTKMASDPKIAVG